MGPVVQPKFQQACKWQLLSWSRKKCANFAFGMGLGLVNVLCANFAFGMELGLVNVLNLPR